MIDEQHLEDALSRLERFLRVHADDLPFRHRGRINVRLKAGARLALRLGGAVELR